MTTSSSSHSHSKGSSSKSKGKGKEKSDRKGSSSRDKTKSTMSRDPYAKSLSNRAGLERYMHEPSYESAWSPVGAASGK
ncbi:hypothetical protein C8A01DRAFT_31456 [Parachaetomium inaequale]|uniref:Uncharacterized protein n=1 Tax=Parachaetomium inaequale TaxID=2588326 RepID=A0AAN6PT72_9PEZI|nr:hypothetical protein C8A01DRAFT_31456 [Parachaetomium inaequale]